MTTVGELMKTLGLLAVFALQGCGSSNAAAVAAASLIPPTSTNITNACIPVGTGSIGFSGLGYKTTVNIFAGQLPSIDALSRGGGLYGNLQSTMGGVSGPYIAPNNRLTSTPDGGIKMSITPMVASMGNIASILGSQVTVAGTIYPSALTIERVLAPSRATTGIYGSMTNLATLPMSVCVYVQAISLAYYGNDLYGGRVYLKTNNNVGVYMSF